MWHFFRSSLTRLGTASWYRNVRPAIPKVTVPILCFALVYTLAYASSILLWEFVLPEIYSVNTDIATAPLYLVQQVIPVLLAIWLVGKVRSLTSNPLEPTFNLNQQEVLNDTVVKILRSEKFYTSLNEALPRGEKDQEYGLDYIPYMLHSIQARRRRFQIAARWFLVATIILGLVFASIIAYFGYVLLNDESTGVPRSLKLLREESKAVREVVNANLDSFSNVTFQSTAGRYIDTLYDTDDPGEKNREVANEINQAIDDAKLNGDLLKLSEALSNAQIRVTNQGDKERKYAGTLLRATSAMSEFLTLRERELSIRRLNQGIDNLEKFITEATIVLQQNDSQITEILKRLAIGIIVSSLFLVILRYVAGIYQSNHQQMLLSELDDLMVRRFYIAYKGAEEKSEERKQVISSFMANSQHRQEQKSTDGPELTKAETDLLKQLLESLTKKL